MITAEQLGYSVNGVDILRDINTHIASQQITTILGPNGAGKSTLLKCLCGSLSFTAGKVSVHNRDIKDYSLKTLSLMRAVLSQSNPINFPFNVIEIVAMGRNPFFDQPQQLDDDTIIEFALKAVDAWHLRNRIYPTLSGGEQQRVQIARVLAQVWEQEQAILFFDEPTTALDIKHQHQVLQLIRKLVNDRRLTAICVLHDLNLARHYSDNAILMQDGKIHAQGITGDILNLENIEAVYDLPLQLVRSFHYADPSTSHVSG